MTPTETLLAVLPMLAPGLLFLYAWLNLKKGHHIWPFKFIGLTGIGVALLCVYLIYQQGPMQTPLIGYRGLGFSLRLDGLSTLMFTMITLLGFVILSFSDNYLDGDTRKGVFFSRLTATIGAVELLVLAGNLLQIFIFWVITSICLHYLLKFYRNRPQAVAAARKKFLVARAGDLCLFGALLIIYQTVGSGELSNIFTFMNDTVGLNQPLVWATLLLAGAAVLKSAQFPTHGWLIEVVETPTPVSALLHAGLLNAGPFLVVRLGYLMIESTAAALFLIIIGGFTALFASVVYLTQPSIKISLGYSSVGHMGFSLMLCGFGVYPAAILHVVAHSFYKAHSFLSSGSAVDRIRAGGMTKSSRNGKPIHALISLMMSTSIYAGFCYLWGIRLEDDFHLMVVGGIMVLGVSQLLLYTIDTSTYLVTWLLSGALALFTALSFFSLESGIRNLLSSDIPTNHELNDVIKWVAITVLILFTMVIFIQSLASKFRHSAKAYRLGVHLRNGLYANVIFDRIIGSLKNDKFKWANLDMKEDGHHDLAAQAKKIASTKTFEIKY